MSGSNPNNPSTKFLEVLGVDTVAAEAESIDPSEVFYIWEFGNGRRLLLCAYGAIDCNDIDIRYPLHKQAFNYTSWEELFQLLDEARAKPIPTEVEVRA